MPRTPFPLPRLGYQPSLDGLRGVAVATVLVFHLNRDWMPGGFLGVDIFFVLSGFLITTLLLEEHLHTGRLSLRSFFYRRILRLYPALMGLVVVSTAFTFLSHKETDASRAISIASSVLFYYANWLSMADTKGWFGGMPHTWSLSIEGQFYVLWAMLVFICIKLQGDPSKRTNLLKTLAATAGLIVFASACWRATFWTSGAMWLRPYLGTDTRLDGLFIGALVALSRLLTGQHEHAQPTNRSRGIAISAVEIVCLALLAFLLATVSFGSAWPWYAGFAAASLATAGLLFSILHHPDRLLGRALRFPPLLWLGKISYSLYIWHVPVLKALNPHRLAGMGLPVWAAEGLRVFVSILLAAASYYLIEKTFTRLKNRPLLAKTGNAVPSEATL